MKNAYVIRSHRDDGLFFAAGQVVTGMPDDKLANFTAVGLVREATDGEVKRAGDAAIAFTTFRAAPAAKPKRKAPKAAAAA